MEWDWEQIKYLVTHAYKRFNMIERLPDSLNGVYSGDDFIQIGMLEVLKKQDMYDPEKGNLSTFVYNTARLSWLELIKKYSWGVRGGKATVSSIELPLNKEGLKLSDTIGDDANIEENEIYLEVKKLFTNEEMDEDLFNYIMFNEGTLTSLGKKYSLSAQGFKNEVVKMKEKIKVYLGGK